MGLLLTNTETTTLVINDKKYEVLRLVIMILILIFVVLTYMRIGSFIFHFEDLTWWIKRFIEDYENYLGLG
jgi:hypothetical protein